MKHKLNREEQEIEDAAETFRPVSKKKLHKVESIIRNARKSKNINIRISGETLDELKRRSQIEGLPYQTLIASILHKYVTNRLVDEEAVQHAVRVIKTSTRSLPASRKAG